ncbi:alpha/beta hydrolase [soil metagenome]
MDVALSNSPRRLTISVRDGDTTGEMSVLDFGDPKRPVDLVFAHANGFNAATYRSLLAPLSSALRIWAPDLRGHGRTRLSTETRGRWNWHDHRDDLMALLDALDGPPVALAGHSMGGTASLLAAVERAGRVSRLLLFDPVILPREASALFRLPLFRRIPGRIPLAQASLKRRERFDSRDQALMSWRGRGAFKGWSEMMLTDYVSEAFVDEPDGGVRLACSPRWESSNYASQSHDPWHALRHVSRPVRILKAEAGSTCSLPLAPRGLPRVIVETVLGGGHLFPMTMPDVARDALFDAAI